MGSITHSLRNMGEKVEILKKLVYNDANLNCREHRYEYQTQKKCETYN